MAITTTVHVEGDKMRVKHNRREGKLTQNIDPDKPHLTVRDTPILDAYEELFGDAIREYNAKQKRKDRKIDGAKGYYHKIELDPRQHNAYEAVLTLGNKDNHLSYEDSKDIFLNFLDEFEKQFPNCKVIGFYIHGDEQGAIHAHIDFIPVAHQCKRGISTGVSMSGALAEMGIVPDKDKNPSAIFTDMMRDILDDCTRKQGHEVQEHVHKDKVDRRSWLSTEAYAKMKDNARLDKEQKEISAKLDSDLADLGTVDKTLNVKLEKLNETSEELNDLLIQSTVKDAELQKKQKEIKTLTNTIQSLAQKIPPLNDFLRMLADLWKMMDEYKHRQALLKGLKDEGYTLYNENEGKEIDINALLVEDALNENVEGILAQAEDVIEEFYEM